MLLLIDLLMLRSREYQSLLQLYQDWEVKCAVMCRCVQMCACIMPSHLETSKLGSSLNQSRVLGV